MNATDHDDDGQRRQSQAALEASEAAYRAMFEANPQPMWVYALDSLVFLAVNDAAVAHYGYRREEFLRMTIRDIRPPEDLTRLSGTLGQLGVGGIHHTGQWHHQRKDGSLMLVEITSHDLVFDHRPSRLVLAYDVTERERAVAALRQQRDTLERFNSLAVDRELAMIQLKRQVNALSRQLGQAAPFDLDFVDDPDAFEARYPSMADEGHADGGLGAAPAQQKAIVPRGRPQR